MPKKYRIHLILFVISIVTTTLAGAEWMYSRFLFLPGKYGMSWQDFLDGFNFSFPFLLFLTIHEFGHYFTARYYHIKASLPYYIPVWLGFLFSPSIGTMGAFIKILDKPRTTRQFFDIGVAGPLAGFVVAIIVLFIGFRTLPPPEHIYTLHPEYQIWGDDYADIVYDLDTVIYKKDLGHLEPHILNQLDDSLRFSTELSLTLGSNLLFDFFKTQVAPDPSRVPNMKELYHYPWLFAGYLALFFTALNLLPVGQLDGGHVVYGLLGYRRSRRAFRVIFVAFILYAGFGLVTPRLDTGDLLLYSALYFLYLNIVFRSMFPDIRPRILLVIWVFLVQFVAAKFFYSPLNSYVYLVFGFVVGRFLGVEHPPSESEVDIGWKRKVLGWITILIFILCFTPSPFNFGKDDRGKTGHTRDIPGKMVKNHYMAGDTD